MRQPCRLLEMLEKPQRMTRGRLCVLSRSAKGGRFYHLQYRKDTKLFQRYIPLGEVAAYEESTERFREFMSAVDAYVDEMSRKGMAEIRKEAKDARAKVGKARSQGVAADGRQEHQHGVRTHAGQDHRGVGSMPTHKKRNRARPMARP